MTVDSAHLVRGCRAALLLAGLLLTLSSLGCGRVYSGGDGGGGDAGRDGGGPIPDGAILPDGAVRCELLDPSNCERYAACQLYSGCATCNGPAPVSCGPAGAVGGPCPDIACISCEGLDEASCRANSSCQVSGCPDCEGGTSFVSCYDPNFPPPPIGCPAIACANPCENLDADTCEATPGCFPYYDCFDCSGNQEYFGCFDENSPPPPVGCPPVACPDCFSLDVKSCQNEPSCTLSECQGCFGEFFVSCGPANSGGFACPEPVCPPDKCFLMNEQDCFNSTECHPVYQPQQGCGCVAPGCCTFFSQCVPGKTADCVGPAACDIPSPLCEGPYVLGYTGSCYEGCVLSSSCGP